MANVAFQLGKNGWADIIWQAAVESWPGFKYQLKHFFLVSDFKKDFSIPKSSISVWYILSGRYKGKWELHKKVGRGIYIC